MIEFFVNINSDNTIKGEGLLIKAFKGLSPGRYRCELYNTNKRSLNQNSYMHVVFTLAQKGWQGAGYSEVRTMDDAKRKYKEMFLEYNAYNEQTGEEYKMIRGTHLLSKDEMGVFIDQVRDHCLEWFGVKIPTPDEWKEQHGKYDLVALAK